MEGKRQGRNTWTQFDDTDDSQATRIVQEARTGFSNFQTSQEGHSYLAVTNVQPNTEVNSPPGNVPNALATVASHVHGYEDLPHPNTNPPVLTEWPHPPTPNRTQLQESFATTQPPDAHSAAHVLDPWVISPEQKAYYFSQFLRLQPDPRSKLSGLQAKSFFQLSKLPNTELSDIWELSDADCDGQLTLGEFCVAMHLVVLRRNGIPVPRILPCALLEVITSQSLSTLASSQQNGEDHPPTFDEGPVHPSGLSHKHTFSPIATRHPHGSPSPLTPNSQRQQRRWSISSQSDISSIAEGIMHFESRPNPDSQLQHPIPMRAHTLPREGVESEAPQSIQPIHAVNDHETRISLASSPPPPPPPRARFPPTLVARQNAPAKDTPGSQPVHDAADRADGAEENIFEFPPGQLYDQVDSVSATLYSKHRSDSNAVVAQLRRECDGILQANEKLAHELMQLQQRRIALKILLERLMPLDAGYPTGFEY